MVVVYCLYCSVWDTVCRWHGLLVVVLYTVVCVCRWHGLLVVVLYTVVCVCRWHGLLVVVLYTVVCVCVQVAWAPGRGVVYCCVCVQVAWAPGRGVKGPAYQSCWDLDHGVSFIPWEKLKSTSDVENVCEGGWVDPATLPHGLRKPGELITTIPSLIGSFAHRNSLWQD